MSTILVKIFVLSLHYAPLHQLELGVSEHQSVRALELSNMNLSLILLFGSTLTYSFFAIVAFVPVTATLNTFIITIIIIITVLLAAINIINVTVITNVFVIILIIYISVAIFVIVIFNLDISVNPSRNN